MSFSKSSMLHGKYQIKLAFFLDIPFRFSGMNDAHGQCDYIFVGWR